MHKIRLLAGMLALFGAACSGDVTGPTGDTNPHPTQPAWVWQNPLPHGNGYNAIEAFGGGRAITLTRYEALETTDGGQTWQPIGINTDTNKELWIDLHRRNSVVTILTTDRVYVSADNGRAWRRGRATISFSRQAAAFWNARRGIVVGLSGAIATTTDGGDSWTPHASGTTRGLFDVAYLDSLTVFAAGQSGTVLRSLDGGASWKALEGTGAADPVYAIDITPGVIRMVDGDGQVITSLDGGTSWSTITVGIDALFDIDFLDVDRGITAGNDGSIRTTANGGATWFKRAPQIIDDLSAVSYSAGDELWVGGDGGALYRSTNAGSDWDDVQTGHKFDLVDVSFANADTGMAVGPACGLVTTANGGRKWVRASIPSALTLCTAGDLNGVCMTSPTTAVVVGAEGGIWTTSNRGFSWATRNSGVVFDLHAVAFGDANNGIAVGDAGTVLVTGDGGATWTLRDASTSENMNGVAFGSAEIAMIVGDKGTVRRSGDAGLSWASADNGFPDIKLLDIAMPAENAAVVIGQPNVLFRTRDCCALWLTQQLQGWINSVAFDSSGRGYVTGDRGVLHVSDDGGVSWRLLQKPVNSDLLAASAIGGNIVTVVGDDGAILRSTTGGE